MIINEVKKCMSNFKRTHLDSWEEHKTKFTEDQLVVLQDLLVSPNYYAWSAHHSISQLIK